MQKVFLVAAAVVFCASAAAASEKVDGTFTAVRDCEAYQSFSKGTNPGASMLQHA
jgi:ribonuclease T2